MMINAISTPCESLNGVQGAKAQTPETAQPENCFLSVLDQMLGNPTAAAGSGREEKPSGIAVDFSAMQSQSEAEEDSAETKPDETQNITAALPFLFAVFGQTTNTDNSGIPTALNTDPKLAAPTEGAGIASVNVSVPLTKTDNKSILAEFSASAPNGTALSGKTQTIGNGAQPEPVAVLTEISKAPQGAAAQEISQEAIQQEIVMTNGNQNALSQAEIVGSREAFDTILSKTNEITERITGLDNGRLFKEGGPVCFSNVTTDHAATKFKMSQDGGTAQNNHTNLGKSADQTIAGVLQDATPAGGHGDSFHIKQIDSTVSGQTQKPSDLSFSSKAETEDAVCKKEKPIGIQEEAFGLITVKGGGSPQMVTEATQTTNEAEAFSQVSEQVTQALSDKDSANFKMKLHPAGLGEISVTLTCQDGKVTLAIVTENPATQKLLAGQADELKAALLAKNYEVTGLNVSASSGSESHTATNNPFSLETGFSGSDTNSAFTFSERSWGNEQNDQNREYSEYSFADHALGREEEKEYRNWQGYYTGRLNFWA